MLVFFALLIIAAVCGCDIGVAVRQWPAASVTQCVTRAIGREVRRRGRLEWFIRARVDPAAATGLALTIALAVVVVAGPAVGVLIYMVRARTGLTGADGTLAVWGAVHATGLSTTVLRLITQLGATLTVVAVRYSPEHGSIVASPVAPWPCS